MRLNRVILDNFKSFSVRTEIDLTDPDLTDQKNVILIAGMNGAGKTSVLEAIRTCLYGADADFVLARFNRRNLSRGRADMELGLDLTLDNDSTLAIRRRWTLEDPGSRDPRHLRQELDVRIDDRRILSSDSDKEWRELVELVVPLGVSQFFFFDGEKIQELSADVDPGERLRESMESVLGIQLYRTLAVDLESLVSRLRRAGATGGMSRVMEAQAQVQAATEETELLAREAAEVEEDIGRLVQQKEGKESQLRGSFGAGADFLAQRDELTRQRSQTESELDAVDANVLSLAKSALPFVVLQGQLRALKDQIGGERRLAEWHALVRASRDKLRAVAERLVTPSTPCCDRPPTADLVAHFADRLAAAYEEEIARRPEGVPESAVLGLSDEQQTSLEAQIENLLSGSAQEVRLLLERRLKTLSGLRAVELQLQRLTVSDGAERQLADLIQEATNVNQNLGRRREQVRELTLRSEDARDRLKEAQRKLRVAEEEMVVGRETHRRVELAEKARRAVLDFVDEMRRSRAAVLQQKVMEMYHRLASRADALAEVRIDPQTYHVSLIGQRGEVVPKSELSAGEKEVYAVCLLWGLAQTAQRKLPIVIDTPLARLDSTHRDNIVRRYLPAAGHQVIVLSTDTEIDEKFYAVLEPFVAQAAQLRYDVGLERTVVESGYFWRR